MKNRWAMVNVVFYDGSDAYVAKFVTKVDDSLKVLDSSKKAIEDYIRGNGEVLMYDALYFLEFENITALENSDNAELTCAFDRFKKMYF